MGYRLAGLTNLLNVSPADIVLLQEIILPKEQLELCITGLGFHCAVNIDADSPSCPGTAVLWKSCLPVDEVINFVVCRSQILKIGQIVVINIYAPSGSTKRQERNFFFSQEIFRVFTLYPQSFYVLSGDFNSVLAPRDIENGIGFNQKNCPALKDLIFSFNLIDAFRAKFPDKEEFTFHRAGRAASRLDRFYIPATYSGLINIHHMASLSDHYAVFLEIETNDKFPKFPKFPSHILEIKYIHSGRCRLHYIF